MYVNFRRALYDSLSSFQWILNRSYCKVTVHVPWYIWSWWDRWLWRFRGWSSVSGRRRRPVGRRTGRSMWGGGSPSRWTTSIAWLGWSNGVRNIIRQNGRRKRSLYCSKRTIGEWWLNLQCFATVLQWTFEKQKYMYHNVVTCIQPIRWQKRHSI